jgi:hypothetical protein
VTIAARAIASEYTNVLEELLERRERDCRLLPDRALETLDEAEHFLLDRGLLTRNPSLSLPSLFGACHEEPYRAGAGGFGEWPSTKWPWSFELALRPGVVAPKIHLGKTLYLSPDTARLADPIIRDEIDRLRQADPDWARVLDHLVDAGPSTPADLCVELGPRTPTAEGDRAPLERCGAIVGRWRASRTVLQPLGPAGRRPGSSAADLANWSSRRSRPQWSPDREPRRWFPWRWLWREDLDRAAGRGGPLVRPSPGWLAADGV